MAPDWPVDVLARYPSEAARPIEDLVSKLTWIGSERVFEAGCGTGYATALLYAIYKARAQARKETPEKAKQEQPKSPFAQLQDFIKGLG